MILRVFVGLMMLRQHSVMACDNGFYTHRGFSCCRCLPGWFVTKNCSMTHNSSEGTQCLQCKDCEKIGLKTISLCTNFSNTVCTTESTTIPTTTPVMPVYLGITETVIALCVTASVVVLLIIAAAACKLYLNNKAPVDPAKRPLKPPSITESLA